VKALNIFKGLSSEEIRLLVLLGSGSFLLQGSLHSINVALPVIQDEFDISLSALKWVSIIGAIMMASLSLCFGRVGDIIGRRRVYRTGIFIYAVGAGLTATSITFPQLMGFRVLMAVGLAMATPLAAAIMAATVNPQHRGQVMGLFATFSAAGQLTGPTLGGFIMDLVSWRAIFVTNMSLGLVLCVAQHFFLKGIDERRREVFDYWGAALLLVGYPSLLIALSYGPGSGWLSGTTMLWFLIAGVGLVSFFYRESHFQAPLFRLYFFKGLPFCIAIFTLVIASFIQSPISIFTPLYLQNVLTIDASSVGLIMMALPISTLIAGPIGGRLADKYNPRVMAGVGTAVTCLAVFFYAQLGVGTAVLCVVIPLVLVGIGGAFFRPANQVAVYASISRSEFGALSAMLTSIGTLAGTLGTTIMVAINESRTASDSPAAFAEAQQFTFMLLVPLLLLSVFVSFAARSTSRRDEPVASGSPAG
jgi:EmrB/QacA subfamily drug resistance transporter